MFFMIILCLNVFLGSSAQLQIASLPPNQSTKYSLPLSFNNAVQKMEPLDTLQIAVKNNIKVFYFATTIPIEVSEHTVIES